MSSQVLLSDLSSKVKACLALTVAAPRWVDTAALLFRRQGYAATGVNQILAAAQVNAGSLYHHFPDGKQALAAAVVDTVGGDIEKRLRKLFSGEVAGGTTSSTAGSTSWPTGLSTDRRDGCPIEPIATESVNASQQVRDASARAFGGWCLAVADRLRADGWPSADADQTALAVVALIEGALILSRIAGDTAGGRRCQGSGAHTAQPSKRSARRALMPSLLKTLRLY